MTVLLYTRLNQIDKIVKFIFLEKMLAASFFWSRVPLIFPISFKSFQLLDFSNYTFQLHVTDIIFQPLILP